MIDKAKKTFYITTSIAYANASPHIGFSLESIQADVLARFHRLQGEEVFFLTGTDEHGLKIMQTAEKAGKFTKEFVDEITAEYEKLKKVLNLSNDDFIRTTDQKRHWPVVENVWRKMVENGDIYKKMYKGLYCVGCESFVKEKDLVDNKCPNHQKEPQMVEEENYFFKLSKYQDKIKEAIKENKILIVPDGKRNEMLSFVDQGLEDISFSRSSKVLKWGIPVPGDDSQTIYVWADALTNYISAIGYGTDNFEKYWPADIHCIGKDIQKFHCVFWPAILMSLGLELPKTIFVHGYITVNGQKMSKSLGNVVDPFELVKKYGTDSVRYYLLREILPTEDGDFTIEKFEQRYNADLAGGIGNLVARVITLADKNKVETPNKLENEQFIVAINNTKLDSRKFIESFKFNEALSCIWELIAFCNRYIDQEKPWQESANQKEVIGNLLFTIKNIAEIIVPFLPQTSEKILKQLESRKSEPLFPRI